MNPDLPAGLAPGRMFGPWAADLDPAERRARLRSLRAIVRLLTGPRGAILSDLLAQAETDEAVLPVAADALDRLPSLDLRRVLGSYAGLSRPVPLARRASTSSVRAFRIPVAPRPSARTRPRRPRLVRPVY